MKSDVFGFERLVERNRDDLYGFAVWITRSEEEAAEIAQESFLSAYLQLSKFRNEAEFRAWVHWTVAKQVSIRRQLLCTSPASEGALKAPETHTALGRDSMADWNSADEQPLSAELRRAIEDATDQLPQNHREAFLFKDVAGLSYEQIADVSGQSISSIKEQLHQARLSLREAIDRFYSER